MRGNLLSAVLVAGFALGVSGQDKPPAAEQMNISKLEAIISQSASQFERTEYNWQFEVSGVRMVCVVDLNYDRMRIIAPITPVDEITSEHKEKMLEANFHSALDARYGISDGVVWAAYIHPLSPLEESEVASALRQVATLASTFGTTYTSGELIFGESSENE